MFRIVVLPQAAAQIRRLRRTDAVAILDAIEAHLRNEPERVSRSRIKRLRGQFSAAYRLRVGNYQVFYDVAEKEVVVTASSYGKDTSRKP
jgi:addiction module RelE/StbE family toxin